MAEAINIILYEKNHPKVEFVEIQNDNGESIRVGERIGCGDRYVRIRITPKDIEDA